MFKFFGYKQRFFEDKPRLALVTSGYKLLKAGCLVSVFGTLSCQNSIDTENYLKVRMLGTLVEPEGVSGSYVPLWQQYTLEEVFLSPDPETGEALSLAEEAPGEFKIIGRSQIIFKKKIDEAWVGEEFDTLVMRFSTSVVGAGKYNDNYDLELTETDIGYLQPFTIEEGQGLSAVIQVQWKNTVTRLDDQDPQTETWELPAFDVSVALD